MPTVDLADLRLHYELSGPVDGPALVLANSLGSSLQMWDKVLPFLAETFRVLRFDTRGHGKSSVPAPPYSIGQLGGDLLGLLDHLSMQQAHLCGLSLGGLMAQWIGVHAPQRVRRTVLANTGARIGTYEGWQQRIIDVQYSGMEQLAAQTLERWFTHAYRERNPNEMESVRKMFAATDAVGYIGCCHALRDADLRSAIATIQSPCLVIAATHDPATPPAASQALHSALQGSTYVELEASHLSAWERSEEFAREVSAFLSEEW